MPLASLVKESPTEYIRHDQLFKELIYTFFKEFLEAFFPDVHQMVDFQAIKPLSEEVFTDLIEGETRRLDIVVEANLKGTDSIIIIHVEPQSTKQTNFHERMYIYFRLLYHKYRKPIIPIAVFSYEENWEKNQYTMEFPILDVLTFNYLTLHLRKQNWRDYIESNNPAAAALLSKMGYSEEEEEVLMDEIKQMDEADKIMEIPISYEEKGKENGIKEVALEMLKKGSSVDFIAEVTKLDKEKIVELKRKL